MTKFKTEEKILQDALTQIKTLDSRINILNIEIQKHNDMYLVKVVMEEDGFTNTTTGIYDNNAKCLYTLDHFSRIKIHNNNILCFLDLPIGISLVTHYLYNGTKLVLKNNLEMSTKDESEMLFDEGILIITEKNKKRIYNFEKGFGLDLYDNISKTFDPKTLKFSFQVSAKTIETNEYISTNLIGFMGLDGKWLINILHDELQEKPVKITEEHTIEDALTNTKKELENYQSKNAKRVLKKQNN